jgi:predicted porin
MKKSLIALAVASAVSAPAFAATSNVDVYGQLTVSYDYLNTDNKLPAADKKLHRISSNASRFGFKGSEDLGGGLAAIWQIENQLDMDGASFSTGLRNTFVGLKSDAMGTVLLGNYDSPYKTATGKLDIFADTAGDFNNISGNVQGATPFDQRLKNTVQYMTPSFNGLSGALAYAAQNETGNGIAANPSTWAINGMYENGPLFGSLAYEKHTNIGVGVFGSTLATDDQSAWKAGAGYKFGDLALGLIYERLSQTGSTVADRNAWYLNGAYTMGNIVLKAAYGQAGDGDTVADTGAKSYTLGADYVLSKRSKMYALYSKTKNDAGGTYGIGAGQGSAYIPAAGEDPSVFSLGMRHSF